MAISDRIARHLPTGFDTKGNGRFRGSRRNRRSSWKTFYPPAFVIEPIREKRGMGFIRAARGKRGQIWANLTPDAITNACEGKLRLFSIDGGHTAKITYNDLSLARQTLSEGGLIILDDFFHEAWPGVAEGTCRYMREHEGALFPVAIAGNKYIFTNNELAAKTYIDRLDKTQKGHYPKRSQAFGKEVLILRPITSIRIAISQTQVWKNIRHKPLGIFLKRIMGG